VSIVLVRWSFRGGSTNPSGIRKPLGIPNVRARELNLEEETRCVAAAQGNVTVCVQSHAIVILAGNARRVIADPNGPTVDEPVDAAAVASLWSGARQPSTMELLGDYAIIRIDRRSGEIQLAVDRHGQASMYVCGDGESLWMCTEPFPLLSVLSKTSVDTSAFPDMFALRSFTGASSLWTEIRQVVPGQWLRVNGARTSESVPIPCYRFDVRETSDSIAEAARRVEAGMRRRLERLRDEGVTDVGIPLSGGVDSAIIAAIAQRIFPRCRAYTMRMEGFANPEVPRAEEVARRIGIPLSVVSVSNQDIRNQLEPVVTRLQEPPRHFNNMPLLRMLEEIGRDSSVVLAGDGVGQFGAGGLGTSLRLAARKRQLDTVPLFLRPAVAVALASIGGRRGARVATMLRSTLSDLVLRSELLEMTTEAQSILSPYIGDGTPTADTLKRTFFPRESVVEMQILWGAATLTRAIYRRNSRLADQAGVQFVYPLLDPSLLEIAESLPVEMRYNTVTGVSKPVLRQVCANLVGSDVAFWSKIGFATPEVEWIQGPLRDIYLHAFSTQSLAAELFDVQRLFQLPLEKNKQMVWTIMTLEVVLRRGDDLMRHTRYGEPMSLRVHK